MPYDSLDITKDNFEHDIDLDLGSFECQAELDHNFTTPDNDA